MVKSEFYGDRELAACFGRDKGLDILVHDENADVRWWVADQGRGQDLDILVKDPDWMIRQAVAEYGRPQDLDILVRDEDPAVIKTVIHSGRGKDLIYILLNEYDNEVILYAALMFRRRFGKYTDAYMELFN